VNFEAMMKLQEILKFRP